MLISETMIDKQGIKKLFDFCQGRKVMLHSSYKAFGKVKGGPSAVVEAFMEITELILFPTFTFQAWCHDHYWDQAETFSEMGIISETARQILPRSYHPIYSFAVYSADADLAKRYYSCRNREAFDLRESPFAKFYEDGGLIVSIGPESHKDTFSVVHYAELKADVDYRRIKEFYGTYKIPMHQPKLRGFSMFVRSDIHGIITDPDPAIDVLVDEGVVKKEIRFIEIPEPPEHVVIMAEIFDIKRKEHSVLYTAEMVEYIDRVEEIAREEPDLLRKVKVFG